MYPQDAIAQQCQVQKGDESMGNQIEWETDLDAALRRAQTEKKTVILDFFNPG
jgi:hypothetical protein